MVNLSVTYNSYIEDFLSLFDLQSFPQCDLRNYVQTSTEVKVNRYLWPIWGRRRVVWCSASSLVSGFPRECSGLTTSHTEGRKWHRWGQYLAHSQTEPHSVSTHIEWTSERALSHSSCLSLSQSRQRIWGKITLYHYIYSRSCNFKPVFFLPQKVQYTGLVFNIMKVNENWDCQASKLMQNHQAS